MRLRRVMCVVVLSLSLSGCAWFQRLKDDPIAALQEGLGYMNTALGLARTAFEVWAATNPELAVGVRHQFTEVTGTVQRGMMVAQDGLRLAANARGPSPDVPTLLRDSQTAMRSVHDFLANLPGNGPGRASHPSMRDALLATERAATP